MRLGPSADSSFLEQLLAVLFVLLAVGMLVFAFVMPIAAIFQTTRERWPNYTRQEKRKILTRVVVAVALVAFGLWFGTDPSGLHNH